ncbi:MAG: class I SAM-dependent methyltransferase [Rhodoferax sp.]
MNYPFTGTNREQSLWQYGLRAPVYDLELTALEPIRRNAIDRLQLEPGATVLDVGCGTGLSFEPLQAAVGQSGQIIGIEQCHEMLDLARARVTQQGWINVTLLDTTAEVTSISTHGDAALFHFTHDILRNPNAIGRVVQCVRPGARIVAAGLQWSCPWAWVTN